MGWYFYNETAATVHNLDNGRIFNTSRPGLINLLSSSSRRLISRTGIVIDGRTGRTGIGFWNAENKSQSHVKSAERHYCNDAARTVGRVVKVTESKNELSRWFHYLYPVVLFICRVRVFHLPRHKMEIIFFEYQTDCDFCVCPCPRRR